MRFRNWWGGLGLVKWWIETANNQRFVVGAIILLALPCGAVVYAILSISSKTATSDRIGEIGDIFAGATFALAVLAAFVAIAAYGVSTSAPRLTIRLKFWFCPEGQIILVRGPNDNATGFPFVTQLAGQAFNQQLRALILITNERLWSARQPALIAKLRGLVAGGGGAFGGWDVYRLNTFGYPVAYRWETTAIHGNETRELPMFNLEAIQLRGTGDANPRIDFEVYAENFRQDFSFPVEIISPQEWQQRFPHFAGAGFE